MLWHGAVSNNTLPSTRKTERPNQTLLAMLRTLPETKTSHWKDSLYKVVHAYNCTRHEATGFSPFFLLFGRSSRLPVDVIFGIEPNASLNYVPNLCQRMAVSDERNINISESSGQKGKKQYDRKVNSSVLQPGDRVLVRNLSKRGGPGKPRSYWEDTVQYIKLWNGKGKWVPSMKLSQRMVWGIAMLFMEIFF